VRAEERTDFNPLALTAPRRLVRMLLNVLRLRPETAGAMAASLALIAGRSSGMRPASSPNRSATRLTDERRSRRRVSERPVVASSAGRRSARVVGRVGATGTRVRAFLGDFLGIAFFLVFGKVRGGLGRTGLDRAGNSGILPQSTAVMCAVI